MELKFQCVLTWTCIFIGRSLFHETNIVKKESSTRTSQSFFGGFFPFLCPYGVSLIWHIAHLFFRVKQHGLRTLSLLWHSIRADDKALLFERICVDSAWLSDAEGLQSWKKKVKCYCVIIVTQQFPIPYHHARGLSLLRLLELRFRLLLSEIFDSQIKRSEPQVCTGF